MLIQSGLLALLCGALTTFAAQISITIPPSPPQLPNPANLPPSTHAILLGPPGIRYDVPLRRDNSFIFPEIDEASYLLSIYSRDYLFPPVRIDVSKAEDDVSQQTITAWQTFRGNEWSNKGSQYGTGQNEMKIEVRPMAQKDFYLERGGFNLLGFLKSPMILMSLVSVVMIFGLPKMMENMDPEMRQEMEQMQNKGSAQEAANTVQNAMQNFDLASWMAGSPASGGSSGGAAKRK